MHKATLKHTVLLALLGTLAVTVPALASRIIATPFAEVPTAGDYKLSQFALRESRSTDTWRMLTRLDLGMTDRTELGIYIINPDNAPTSTWINLQHRLAKETPSRPTISVGVWDLANIHGFSGQKTGGSFFVAASKKVTVGEGRPPLKLSFGLGTNRLNGAFGGVIAPLSTKLGIMAEYTPKNLRLPETDSIDAGVYYFVSPRLRLRASWVGGNPMLDLCFGGMIGPNHKQTTQAQRPSLVPASAAAIPGDLPRK